MVVGRAAGVHGARLQERPDLVERRRMIAIALAVHRGLTSAGRVEPEDQADRRRLPRTVRTEKTGDDAGTHRERQVVDCALVAVVLRQVAGLDQTASP